MVGCRVGRQCVVLPGCCLKNPQSKQGLNDCVAKDHCKGEVQEENMLPSA